MTKAKASPAKVPVAKAPPAKVRVAKASSVKVEVARPSPAKVVKPSPAKVAKPPPAKVAKPPPAKPAPKGKAAKVPAGAIAAVLAPFGFPRPPGPGLCFDAEGERLFARGYPHLRLLSDEVVAPAAAEQIALEALDAIDPALRLTVPRAVARVFLLGYRVGPLLFVDDPRRPHNAQLRDERLAAMRSTRPIDRALLEETFERRHAWGMGETYARWRWPKVLYLYEAFLGAEPVARAVVRYLLASARDLPRWGGAAADPKRTNTVHHYVAAALPWLLRRVSPAVARELRAELATVAASTAVPTFTDLLRWLAAPAGTSAPTHGFETLDGDGLEQRLAVAKFEFMWHVGRVVWLLGSARLGGPVKVAGFDLPRMVDAVAPLRDPGVVRLVALVSAQRAGQKAAGDWLRAHAAYARPIVVALAAGPDPKEAAAARGALALMAAAAVDEAPVLSEDAVEAEVARIFAALATALGATEVRARQVAAIRAAYEAYTEARAAGGDPTPDAYFTHRFGDFGLGEFGMLAVDAI